MDYKELLNLSTTELRQGNAEKAYQILMDNKDAFVKDTTLYFFIFYIACSLKKAEDAIYYLKEAVITLDMWFNTDFLDGDPTLDVIKDFDDFKDIYNICKQRQTDLRFFGKRQIDVFVPKTKTNKLFFMLPGNFQSIEEVKNTFNQETIEDYIIAIPQTRELHSYERYLWGNIEFGVKVISEHYYEIVRENNISEEDTILSSFATGAKIVLKALIDNSIPANKVIFFSPGIPNLETLEPQIKTLKERKIKIFIVCGENDPHYLPTANSLDKLLTKLEIEHKYILLEGIGHSFPKNTKNIFEEAINFFHNN